MQKMLIVSIGKLATCLFSSPVRCSMHLKVFQWQQKMHFFHLVHGLKRTDRQTDRQIFTISYETKHLKRLMTSFELSRRPTVCLSVRSCFSSTIEYRYAFVQRSKKPGVWKERKRRRRIYFLWNLIEPPCSRWTFVYEVCENAQISDKEQLTSN